jgi:sialic acid synthase SpsE
MTTFVIAEVACTHDGDLYKALELIGIAKSIGADAVKFQWTSCPEGMAHRRHVSDPEAYKLLAFPRDWFVALKRAADADGIEFMCTVYLPEDVSFVAPYVSRFKVSSFEANDTEFLGLHEDQGKEIIVSAGMNFDPEAWYLANDDIKFLYCVSAYPTPISQINLSRLWDGFDGLSDHTIHTMTGALAVAAGAQIIEFHMRLNGTNPDNPDYLVSRTPIMAEMYIKNIRLAERMLGDGVRRVQPCEEENLRYRVRP